jgi:hypothetical protein
MLTILMQSFQGDDTGSLIGAVIGGLIGLFILASMWIVFTKAGQPGWAVIIPIYNIIVLLRVAGKPWWWLFLFMIPLVNIYAAFVTYTNIAKAFGKSTLFGLGLMFLSPIFFPILAFGDSRYQGAPA